jgi:hypothetical protein
MAFIGPITMRDIFDGIKLVCDLIGKCRDRPSIVKAAGRELQCVQVELSEVQIKLDNGEVSQVW